MAMAAAAAMAMGMGKGKAAAGFSYSQTRNMINYTTTTMSWAHLPVDILFIIFGFFHKTNDFNMIDLYQCLAVCRSWRFVAKQIWQNCILPTTPWFVSTIDASEKIVFNSNLHKCLEHPPSFHSNSKNINPSFLFAHDLHDFRTYASYDGWLLVGDSNKLPFLYNPITLVLLQLPPLPEHRLLHWHMKFVSSGVSPTHHDCIICLKFSEKRGLKKLCNQFLAFCRPASSTSWVVLHQMAEDFIFNGGNFYTVGSDGDLFVYNSEVINDNSSVQIGQRWIQMKIADAVIDSNSFVWSHCFFYLLESKQRDLLMIMRAVEGKNNSTTSFRIFKLNRSYDYYDSRRNNYYHHYWKEISNLPEKESIILLWNDSMTISVDDHNGYKSNCIYFYDEDYSGHITTYGIYDLGNCKIDLKSADHNSGDADLYNCEIDLKSADHNSGDADLYNFKLFTPSKIADV
ncbi:hypothetical protein OROHE_025414 [Orobanche hederae]